MKQPPIHVEYGSRQTRKGWWIAGAVIGMAILACLVTQPLWRPVFLTADYANRRDSSRCQANMFVLGQCLLAYAQEQGRFPRRLSDLVSSGHLRADETWLLLCPADRAAEDGAGVDDVDRQTSYAYVASDLALSHSEEIPLMYEKQYQHANGTAMFVLFADGRVELTSKAKVGMLLQQHVCRSTSQPVGPGRGRDRTR